MLQLVRESPLLLLFLVAAVGYLLGRVRIRGMGLGVAMVLFAGLGAGALDPALRLPELVQQFGLAVFVYALGLSSGPGFFAAFRLRGLRDNGLAFGVILLGAGLVAFAQALLELRPGVAVGIFAGSLTNTPALAAVVDYLRQQGASEAALSDPVVGYSVAYPMGIVGVLAAILIARRLSVSHDSPPESTASRGGVVGRTVRITKPSATQQGARELLQREGVRVLFGRMKRGEAVTLAPDDIRFDLDDRVTVVGPERHVERAVAILGEIAEEHLELDRSVLDFRRIFVSNAKVAGRSLADVALPTRFGAVITRLRRGDVEIAPENTTILELGDRVRVVCPRARMDGVTRFLGDSYAALSEIDVVSFSLGIALGLLVGSIPIPTFVGPPFKLGLAGGPLLVGLFLGRVERTGSMVWSLPYSASITLRQLGLVLFLAGVGTRSGGAFISTLRQGGGVTIFLTGAAVTCAVALTCVTIGRKVFKIPLGTLSGMLAGVFTQPAVLAFANERYPDGSPSVAYATVYPLATMMKIIAAQLLVIALSR